jgi:hypothetical protein
MPPCRPAGAAVLQALRTRLARLPLRPPHGERAPQGPTRVPVLCPGLPRLQARPLHPWRRLPLLPRRLRGMAAPLQVPHAAVQGRQQLQQACVLLRARHGRAALPHAQRRGSAAAGTEAAAGAGSRVPCAATCSCGAEQRAEPVSQRARLGIHQPAGPVRSGLHSSASRPRCSCSSGGSGGGSTGDARCRQQRRGTGHGHHAQAKAQRLIGGVHRCGPQRPGCCRGSSSCGCSSHGRASSRPKRSSGCSSRRRPGATWTAARAVPHVPPARPSCCCRSCCCCPCCPRPSRATHVQCVCPQARAGPPGGPYGDAAEDRLPVPSGALLPRCCESWWWLGRRGAQCCPAAVRVSAAGLVGLGDRRRTGCRYTQQCIHAQVQTGADSSRAICCTASSSCLHSVCTAACSGLLRCVQVVAPC